MKIPTYIYLYLLLVPILYEQFIVIEGDFTNTLNFTEFDRFILDSAYSFFCGHQDYCNDSSKLEKNIEDFPNGSNGSIYFDYNNTNYYDYNDFEIPRTLQSDCVSCSCNASTCTEPFLFMNCCPGMPYSLGDHFHTESCSNPLLPPWRQDSLINVVEAIVMIDKCPEHENILPEYKDKCERSRSYADLDIQIPVSVKGTNEIVYKNIHCAYCNRLADIEVVYWRLKVDCYLGVKLDATAYKLEQVIHQIKTNKNCGLRFIPPPTVKSERLKSCGPFISECNVTGQWKHYEQLTDIACRSFSLRYGVTYRNVFCYLCNIDSSNGYIKPSSNIEKTFFPSFSLVLKFTPTLDEMREATSEQQCERFGGVYDFYQVL